MTSPSTSSRRSIAAQSPHTWIVRRQEADLRQQQQAGVELFSFIGLNEAFELGSKPRRQTSA